MYRVSRSLIVILVLFLLATFGTTPVSAGSIVRVDWSMPDRYGLDIDDNGITDALETVEEIQPSSWPILFNTCDSRSLDSSDPIIAFEVEVDGAVAGRFEGCEFSIELPSEGAFLVAVTAVNESGGSSTVEVTVVVRDWLIVGLGDSYASGEGVPDIAMAADGFERALVAYEAYQVARLEVEDLRLDLEALNAEVQEFTGDVEATRRDLEDAADFVASRLRNLNRAKDELFDVRADIKPVKDALAKFKNDCIDDFGLFRCPAATGSLVAALVVYGVSAADELVKDGYNAVKALIDNAEAIAKNGVTQAQKAYDNAVKAKNSAQDVFNAAVDSLNQAEETRDTVLVAVNAASEAAEDAQEIFDRVTSEVRAVWQDEDCHRSAYSAQAQAALAIERLDTRSSVTFVHLACSGAKTNGVVDQIEELSGLVGAREIDAVIMSVGGNDAGFSSIIYSLIRHQSATGLDIDFDAVALAGTLCPAIPGLSDACGTFVDELPEKSAAQILEENLPKLPAGYATVAEKLAELVEPDRVFITDYPDSTRRDDGAYCGPTSAPGITESEWQWVDEVATAQINAAVKAGAEEHGWQYVGAIYDLFEGHGYCADANWMVRLEESAVLQGDMSGTAHPNGSGHAAMGEELATLLAADLSGDGSLIPFRRGDCNYDGQVDISDASKTLAVLFLGDTEPTCGDACDSNDDGTMNISDALATLGALFLDAGVIPNPGPNSCGLDPTGGEIGCESYDACP